VTQHGRCDHTVVGRTSGPLVNVGEYNPGVKQAASLCRGQFKPLNGQDFLRYSGRWGSISDKWGTPPRGPVFQGYADDVYCSWYWLGSNAPAAPSTHAWSEPPAVSARIGSDGSVELSATQNAAAAKFGDVRILYGIADPDADESDAALFSGPSARLYTGGTIAVPAGKRFGYFALDGLNNASELVVTGPPPDRQVQFVVMGTYGRSALPEIKYVAGRWADGAIWYVSREQAVSDIQDDTVRYHVRREDGGRVPLVVDHSRPRSGPGVSFVRTAFDDTKTDNLLSLPRIRR
jgi:hypothetical protein